MWRVPDFRAKHLFQMWPASGSASTVAPIPNLGFQVENYRDKVRTLAIVWLVYAGISLLMGFAGLTFARHFFAGAMGPWGGAWGGPWMHGPWAQGGPPVPWFWPAVLGVAWAALIVRCLLAVAAGWGLLEHASWGRVVAIIAAILSLIKFPFGTAMGIWTLVVLLGYRNATLYQQL